ncbi:hypothetical protein IV203_031391 [Nitzschia inconspicua]|uniref:Uncharacterized protein n=1 Tax=Nitzschia inconspicua TaxID=303405 RepID=A0A9K3LU83_9STRA|nr:hypothetical protein IV203_031391 [Nitzschia inconspicua]
MKRWLWDRLFFLAVVGLSLWNVHLATFHAPAIPYKTGLSGRLIEFSRMLQSGHKKKTIAYAVSITSYDPKNKEAHLLDRAAVLHQSIKLAMQQSTRYHFHLYCFLHPDAKSIALQMEHLGYRVQIRETPFNISDVPNGNFVAAQTNGCCLEKEYIKLYSWLLDDYPVVIHMDLDTLVLRPMDDLFDLMTDPSYDRKRFQNASMWTDMEKFEGPVDFLFTRDYNMVDPPRKKPHQIGVQGGFFAVRPNAYDFQKYIDTIVSGEHWFEGIGWGGPKLRFGGYYGAATIQGLASYYYGHLERNRSIELNRCHYNTMVDEPTHFNKRLNLTLCRTTEDSCQDCRMTPVEDIYTVHFTAVCGKPEWCEINHKLDLCMQLFYKWHEVRWSLEQQWANKYPGYKPNAANISSSAKYWNKVLGNMKGHCGDTKRKGYRPLLWPMNVTERLL